MRNSNLLKWAQNNRQTDKSNKSWLHPPDALQKGHIAYLVKFLGNTEVDQPKGIEIVKEGIRKLKFNQQLRKSEGTKTPKVELTISIDGVAIQEPKTKRILHQYPLHRISYCADDKGEKKFFSFIAKDCPNSERHICFVFVSDKLAEEITLTIGQAFDLAYKRFLETSSKDIEVQKKILLLQQRVKSLEHENGTLKQRLSDILNGQANDLENYMRQNNIKDMLIVDGLELKDQDSVIFGSTSNGFENTNGATETNGGLLLNLSSSSSSSSSSTTSSMGGIGIIGGTVIPPVPPRAFEKRNEITALSSFGEEVPVVGRKLEGLLLDEMDSDEEFNPRAVEAGGGRGGGASGIGVSGTAGRLLLPPPPRNSSSSTIPPCSMNSTSLNNNNNIGNVNRNNHQLLPPPSSSLNESSTQHFAPSSSSSSSPLDPFGMDTFLPSPPQPLPSMSSSAPPIRPPPIINQQMAEIQSAIGILDKRLLEMKDGFSRGISFGNDDFSIESLDPLKN